MSSKVQGRRKGGKGFPREEISNQPPIPVTQNWGVIGFLVKHAAAGGVVTIVVTALGAVYYFGSLNERISNNTEKIQEARSLIDRDSTQQRQLDGRLRSSEGTVHEHKALLSAIQTGLDNNANDIRDLRSTIHELDKNLAQINTKMSIQVSHDE